jgi:hypothetical protein
VKQVLFVILMVGHQVGCECLPGAPGSQNDAGASAPIDSGENDPDAGTNAGDASVFGLDAGADSGTALFEAPWAASLIYAAGDPSTVVSVNIDEISGALSPETRLFQVNGRVHHLRRVFE